MKYKGQILAVLMALIFATGAINAQEKYALLIGGDYKPGTEIPNNHKWNNGQNMDPTQGYSEFWHDTYLMWRMLYDHEYNHGYTNENIEVLFAGGVDYSVTFEPYFNRYDAHESYGFNITDDMATRTNVLSALDDLANVKPEDYVFIWIMSNGGNTDPAENVWSYVYLWDYDPAYPNEGRLYDHELKARLDLIPAHKKVVVVQAPNSGKFATTCADDNTIVYTSSHADEAASRADDLPYIENEVWGGETYYHGEFGYHLYSPLNGSDPDGNTHYGNDPFSDANQNDDDVVSFWEAFEWEDVYNSSNENPAVSVSNEMDKYTSVQYSTVMFDHIYSTTDYMGTLGITGPHIPGSFWTELIIYSGIVTFDKAVMYFLDDTRLVNSAYNNDKLVIEDDVSLFGNDGTSGLVSYTTIEIGKNVLFSAKGSDYWGGLAVQNSSLNLENSTFIDCHATINYSYKVSVTNSEFIRSGIKGDHIYFQLFVGENTNFINSFGHFSGYGSGTAVIQDCHFTGPNIHYSNQFGLQLMHFSDYTVANNIIQEYNYGLHIYNCSCDGLVPLDRLFNKLKCIC